MIRRIFTEGAGFAGVGILRDASGNDTYTGQTICQGAGHFFGVGILSDAAGNDHYFAIRNSQGFALVGGVGLLHDQGGSDWFDFYMPKGGVIDDTGVCDDVPRNIQGAGNVGGLGLFINEGGNDYYRAPTPAEAQVPNAPLAPLTGLSGQGSGANGGIGIFVDLGGDDTYVGVPGRADNTTIGPSPTNLGFFLDSSDNPDLLGLALTTAFPKAKRDAFFLGEYWWAQIILNEMAP